MGGLVRHLGVFGGAFDPPHRAHAALARVAVQQLGLDRLLVVPTGVAWHKARTLSATQHRVAMCKLAFADVPLVEVDERETRRSGPTYTADTLQELQAEYPHATLYLVIGADQAQALHTWHRWDEVVRNAIICVAARADSKAHAEPPAAVAQVPAEFRTLHLPPMALSATDVRHQAGLQQNLAPLVFDSVARYIDHHHLYRSA